MASYSQFNDDDSLPRDQFNELIPTLPRFNEVDPYPENSAEKKEREIIHTNRVKLTDYIHDSTVLFPHMKQHGIFSVYDCDVIKGETVAHNRVDKFIDVLLTKGPRAIGIFHESLGKTYPGVFDYLTRLFASAGIDLPETRRMRPASIIDQAPDVSMHESVDLKEASMQSGGDDDGKRWAQNVSRRGMTVRRSLDMLSRQLETIQTERNELKNALSYKEKEISDLIRSKEKNRDDLLSITQHYQEIYRNLVNWKESLTCDNSQRLQELLAERQCIQAEYDALENDYALVQLELRAARERISRLMSHLERSERLVAFAHEERDALQNKVSQLEGEIQRLERKKQRDLGAGKGTPIGRRDAELEQLIKQIEKAQKDIESSRVENAELSERLTVARRERNEALEEKDSILQKQYLEEQKRKKAESELRAMYKKLQQIKDSSESHSSDGSSMQTQFPEGNMEVKMEDFTTVIQASEDMGMTLGLGILVDNVDPKGLATRSGIKHGDQICQVNHITVTSDRDPLDLCNRLLHNASTFVTLLIRRPVVSYESSSSTMTLSNSGHMLTMIHQTPSSSDTPRKSSTIGRFALPINTTQGGPWDSGLAFHGGSSDLGPFLPTPTSSKTTGGILPGSLSTNSTSPTLHSQSHTLPYGRNEMNYVLATNSLKARRHLTRSKRKNSDDAHSNNTSSSDDFPPDITVSALTDSLDFNHGIVHSPDLQTFHCFPDDELPGTRRPTLKGESEFEEDESVTNYQQQKMDCMSMPAISPRPQYLPMHSSPAEVNMTVAEAKNLQSPRLKRAEAKKWLAKNRRSQSLVDMTDLLQAQNSAVDITDLKLRRVILPWGRLGEGISLVGGRGRGVFIHSTKDDGRGLQTGDEIIKIDNVSTHNMTYSDVVRSIEHYNSKGEQCMITVHSNIEGFKRLPSLEERDCFYVKTLFNHKKTVDPRELTFSEGEILKVTDTMPGGIHSTWRVKRLNIYGYEKDEGLISIEQSFSNWSQTVPAGTSSSLPFIGRFALNRRLNSQPDSFHSMRNSSSIGNPYDLYLPVKKLQITAPRPVIIMGVCDNEVREALLDDSRYSLPPIKTLGSLAMLQDECSQDYILLKRTGENVRYCILSDVKAIAEQDQHCVLVIEPNQLRSNSTLSSIHPIKLLLYTKKSGTFSFKLQVYNCSSDTANKYLQDMKSLEEDFSTFFTGKIEVSGGLENIIKQVKTEISNQQQMTIWEPAHN